LFWENTIMSFLDSVVGQCFGDQKAGRVVVFAGDRRHRGYVVRSESEELKIRSFLKMYFFAQFAIQLLGSCVAYAWTMFFRDALGRTSENYLTTGGLFLGFDVLLVGLPFFLLWRSYRKSLLNFVSAEDEVVVTEWTGNQKFRTTAVAVAAACLVLLTVILFLAIRAR
jgi:hypothetical protein